MNTNMSMSDKDHPETDQLLDYSQQPESIKLQPVGLHLAACAQCRKELQALANLRQHAGWISCCVDDDTDLSMEVDDLMHRRLSESKATALRERIKQNPAELRQALHYARHHVAMKTQKSTKATKSTSTMPIAERIKNQFISFLQFETSVWKLVPVAIVLVTVVALFNDNILQPKSMQLAKIVHFEDQASIQFVAQDSQPGIGFFANAAQTNEPFEGVSISMTSDLEMAFSWPEVTGATGYHLKLQVFKNGQTVVLGRVSGKDTKAVVALPETPGQHRYEWVLTGDTINKQSFQATGGFVVTR